MIYKLHFNRNFFGVKSIILDKFYLLSVQTSSSFRRHRLRQRLLLCGKLNLISRPVQVQFDVQIRFFQLFAVAAWIQHDHCHHFRDHRLRR